MRAEASLRVVVGFDAAWNAHDEEGVLELFTEDAVARIVPAPPGEPDAYEGKEQLRDFVGRHIPGFHVESRDHQAAGHQEEVGYRVIWESTVSSERFRDLGVEEVEGTVGAIVKGGRIEYFTFSLSNETLGRMRAAGEPA
jgi:ketosteroid isomerase-like protein